MAQDSKTTTNITTSSTACPTTLAATDTEAIWSAGAGTWSGVTGKTQVSFDGTSYIDCPSFDSTGAYVAAGTTITLSDSTPKFGRIYNIEGMTSVRFLATGFASGSCPMTVASGVFSTAPVAPITGGQLNATPASVAASGAITTSSPSASFGYAAGAGAAVTQITGRTTGVTANANTGAITLISAAGSATPFSFTVTNSSVAAKDTVIVSQKSGTDAYSAVVSAVAAGSFKLTITDLTGTTTESPVFNFAVIKGQSS
ncbi:MAG TPA: hypothetical protein VN641_18715 [Urbifossiella sp.]|nr:hypothetical protein [Urbifossiella sp.]